MKVIHRTYDVQTAKIIVGFLTANNIDAWLLDSETSTTLPIVSGGVRIAVDDDQADRAISLLNERGANLGDPE